MLQQVIHSPLTSVHPSLLQVLRGVPLEGPLDHATRDGPPNGGRDPLGGHGPNAGPKEGGRRKNV